ncbi:MAG: hypothetical protein IT198_11665 [Acidimicrobiia bacterium]|nr:hypothetical protein [Acidimicrobiia bacterium]
MSVSWTVPRSWRKLERSGPGSFVTRERALDIEGAEFEFTSRRTRKGLGPHRVGVPPLSRGAWHGRGVRWAPTRRGWWIAVLFMIGSACFAVASVPGIAEALPTMAVGAIYFTGSIFFTSAAYLQYLEAVNADRASRSAEPRSHLRLADVQPSRIDWWACSIQLVGTLWFNVNTFASMRVGSDVHEEIRRVWTPDFVGSICFLVASWLAVLEVCHRSWCVDRGDVSWWIVWGNMLGSVFFMASAIAAFVRPDTGDMLSATIANSGTLLGALCFFWAARLLLVELAGADNLPRQPGSQGAGS